MSSYDSGEEGEIFDESVPASDYATRVEEHLDAKEATFSDIWDDRELLQHWHRTIKSFRKHHKIPPPEQEAGMESTFPKWTRVQDVPVTKKRKTDEQQHQPIEPFPTPNDSALHNLLWAWYNAGYYTGYYEAKSATEAKGDH